MNSLIFVLQELLRGVFIAFIILLFAGYLAKKKMHRKKEKQQQLSWKCIMCYKERPDNKITVMVKPLIVNNTLLGTGHIRYCNDNEECHKKAKAHQFRIEKV